jgi:hypothetical protein
MFNNNYMVWSVTNTVLNFGRCQRKTIHTFINFMKFINVNTFKSTRITFFAGRHTIGYNVPTPCDRCRLRSRNCLPR